jgi:hypothetical protein
MTSAMTVATVVGCYGIVGLVPPRSPNLGVTNLKTEPHTLNYFEHRH